MKVTFQINYRTVWGEEVKVILPDGQLFPLRTNNGEFGEARLSWLKVGRC